MGKKYDDALARIREIRNAIPEAADGIMPDGPHDFRAKVTVSHPMPKGRGSRRTKL